MGQIIRQELQYASVDVLVKSCVMWQTKMDNGLPELLTLTAFSLFWLMFMDIIRRKTNLLHQISTVIKNQHAKFPTEYILITGDFNLTPDEWMDR